MPTLRELMGVIAQHTDLEPPKIEHLEVEIRRAFPAGRVYIIPLDSTKDPDRRKQIKQATKHLPDRVVAERYGVSPSWVYRIKKRDDL